MTEERMQILEMVASKTITAEQGNQLLEALEVPAPQTERFVPAPPAPSRHQKHHHHHEHRNRRPADSTVERLVLAARFGIDSEFLQGIREAGFEDTDFEGLVEAAKFGVDSEYIREMRDLGFTDLTLRDLARLRRDGVKASTVTELRALGLLDSRSDSQPQPVAATATDEER